MRWHNISDATFNSASSGTKKTVDVMTYIFGVEKLNTNESLRKVAKLALTGQKTLCDPTKVG